MKKVYLLIAVFLFFVSFQAQAKDEVLATVDGKNFTDKQVMQAAVEQMLKRMKQDKVYELKRAALENMIDDYLMEKAAKKQGITVAQLIKNIQNKADKATESDAKIIYQLQKRRFKDKKFDDVKKGLMAQLSRQKKQLALNDYLDELRKKSKIKIDLKRPRFNVSIDDDPSQGKKGSPITLIEFSEFQCPFCKRTRPTIDKIMNTYKGKVHYVFRDYPLSFHKQAKSAANAANCANEQGKYWDYNTALWGFQGKHKKDKLMEIAKELELEMDKFEKCFDSNKYFAEIDKDQQDGTKVGVSGTPAYFINGIFLSGAQPFEKFKEIIDEELLLKKAN